MRRLAARGFADHVHGNARTRLFEHFRVVHGGRERAFVDGRVGREVGIGGEPRKALRDAVEERIDDAVVAPGVPAKVEDQGIDWIRITVFRSVDVNVEKGLDGSFAQTLYLK